MPHRHLSLALLLALFTCPSLAVSLRAQEPPPPTAPNQTAPAKPSIGGRITGHIQCADTHAPARGAVVLLVPLPAADGKTSSNTGTTTSRVGMDGAFIFEHVSPGEYTVVALFAGYLSTVDELTAEDTTAPSPARSRELLARNGTVTIHGEETENFDVLVERGASVSGHVRYSDGSPAAQLSISIEDIKTKPAETKSGNPNFNVGTFMRATVMQQSQTTDDQGHFRIAGLKPGSYRIAAIQPSTSSPLSDDGLGFLAGLSGTPADLHVYGGDTLHKKKATVYDLRSGDELTGVDITIPLDAFHQVRGVLSAQDGRTINAATLTLTDTGDDSFVFQAEVARDGSFTFTTVPSGTYTVAAPGAKIITVPPNFTDNTPLHYLNQNAANAFADGSTSVIVKGSDVPDVSLTLTEVPLPPAPSQPPPGN
jgi:hypothetical protein